jgi:hypothetical protein
MKVNKDNFRETLEYKEVIATSKTLFPDGDLDDLLKYLEEETDYFWAPASSKPKYHGCWPGGLVQHSLNVVHTMEHFNTHFGLKISAQSIFIVGAYHDLGKTNFYFPDDEPATDPQIRYINDLFSEKEAVTLREENLTKGYASLLIDWAKKGRKEPRPKNNSVYKIVDSFPIGHSIKPLTILQQFLILSPEELCSIRFHMGGYEAEIANSKDYVEARSKYPLVVITMLADMAAGFLMEETEPKHVE